MGGGVDDAARADDAGGADADAEQGRGGGADDLVDEVEHRVDDGLAGVVADRALGADEDVAVEVEHGGAQHLVGGEVDADGLQARAVDVDEGARLAGAHDLGGAELDGVTAVHELGDEVGDGHLAHPEAAGEVGPAHRTDRVEHLEHEREVVPAAVGGQHGGAGGDAAGSRQCGGHES